MNLYGWSKHLFDLALVERRRREREDAAAMGRTEVLQRVRPERVSQGRDDEPCSPRCSTTQRPASRCGCSSRTATASRDGEQQPRFHLCRRRGGGGALDAGDAARHPASSMSEPARRAASSDLITAMFAALGRAPNIEYVDMPAAKSAANISISPQAEVDKLRRAGYNAGFTPLEDAVRRYVTEFLDRAGPLSLTCSDFDKQSCQNIAAADRALRRRSDAR